METLHDRFVKFIKQHKENAYRLAYSYVKNKENALDIVQDSIHKALVSIHTLKSKEAMKSWFYRIVINTSLDFLRKHNRLQVMDDHMLDVHSPKTEDRYADIDLNRALDELPSLYRAVIILRYFEDLKISEIADALDENISTVKTRLYQGLRKMRIAMSEEEEWLEEVK